MHVPVSIQEAKDRLNALVPDVYAAKAVDGNWCIVNSSGHTICYFKDDNEDTGKTARFFAYSLDTVEALLEHIKDQHSVISSQNRTINDLNERLTMKKGNMLQRQVDDLRIKLNRAEQAKEQLIKETQFLRSSMSRAIV